MARTEREEDKIQADMGTYSKLKFCNLRTRENG